MILIYDCNFSLAPARNFFGKEIHLTIRKQIFTIALTAVLGTALGACKSGGDSNAGRNSNGNSVAGNTNAGANTANANAASTAPAANASGGPIDAYKAAYTARKNKDIAELKKLLSKDIIEFLTMIGQADPKKKQTLDEMLKEMCEQPQAPTSDARNEKVNGDKATIEYLDEKGGWQIMDLVKEDGAWKLTIDKTDAPPTGDQPVANKPTGTNDKKQ